MLGCSGSGANIHMLKTVAVEQSLSALSQLNCWMLGTELVVGVLLSCAFAGFFAYSIVYVLWTVAEMLKRSTRTKTRGIGSGEI